MDCVTLHGPLPRCIQLAMEISEVTISEGKEDLEKNTPHPGAPGWLEHQKCQACL